MFAPLQHKAEVLLLQVEVALAFFEIVTKMWLVNNRESTRTIKSIVPKKVRWGETKRVEVLHRAIGYEPSFRILKIDLALYGNS